MIKRIIVLIILLSFMVGCGATLHSNLRGRDVQLRQYRKIHVMLQTATGAVSVQSASFGAGLGIAKEINPSTVLVPSVSSSVGASHAMSGGDQSLLIAQGLAFDLESLGFEIVNESTEAEILALFSIGTVRFDPITGWIADQAFLTLKEAKTGNTLCSFRADVRFITPTVKTLVRQLVQAVERNY